MVRVPKILLVEDSADDAYFFERALKKTGIPCSFGHVSDGAAAVRALEEGRLDRAKLPDIVFLDLKMPVLNGFEVLDWIQRQEFEQAPKVIVLSGSNQESDRVRAASLGAGDYLVKPIKPDELAARLTGQDEIAAEQGPSASTSK